MAVVMALEPTQHACGVSPVDDQDSVEQYAADGADEAFGDGVRPWCPHRRSDDSDVHAGDDGVEASDVPGRFLDAESYAHDSDSLTGGGGRANVEHASDLNRPEQVRTAFNCTGAACAESVSAGQRSCRAELADKRSHTRRDRLIKALSCGKTGL
jgi:hypothetical protein